MTTTITHHTTGKVLYTSEKTTVRGAVIEAVAADANLTDAYLTGANLADANLTDANLTRANLTRAYLTRANLTGANLTGAYLTDADLTRANLTRAYLTGANLTRANLTGALDGVPLVENLDAAILAAVEASQLIGKAGLDMRHWHTCESTHCRAGWAIHLAGPEGYKLEERFGSSVAGALIYAKAGATLVPDFYASDDAALTDMRARAGVS